MALLLNRAKAATATSGTGTVTLGSAVTPFRTWAAAGAVHGGRYSYLIEDGNDWEIGEGVFDSGAGTITRNLIASSTGSLLALTGTATIACVANAKDHAGFGSGQPVVPAVADMTWYNQDTSTATDGEDAIILRPQVNAELHGLYIAAPSAPFDVYLRMETQFFSSAAITANVAAHCGLILQDSADGETVALVNNLQRVSGDEQHLWSVECSRWNSAGVFVSTPYQRYGNCPMPWLRYNVTSTTITPYCSFDGKNWFELTGGIELLSAYIDNVNRIGFAGYGAANNGSQICQVSYFSTVPPV
jgi:hypothetical protein